MILESENMGFLDFANWTFADGETPLDSGQLAKAQ
jgi:hypothetical protein